MNEHNFELSDAEVKEGMAAAGVDLDALDEFLNDKVPTEFDLTPSELEYNDSDWIQKGSTIYAEYDNDGCGSSISLNDSGTKIAIGSPENDNGASD